MGRDRKTKRVFRIPDLGPLLSVLLLPKGDQVLVEDIRLYRSQATMTRLIAADCDDDVFCKDGFTVLLDLGAYDLEDGYEWNGKREKGKMSTHDLRIGVELSRGSLGRESSGRLDCLLGR